MNDIDREIDKLMGTIHEGWRIDRIESYLGFETIGPDAANRRMIHRVDLVNDKVKATAHGEAFTFGQALENAVDVVTWLANQ